LVKKKKKGGREACLPWEVIQKKKEGAGGKHVWRCDAFSSLNIV
jgi:hypothetical protein